MITSALCWTILVAVWPNSLTACSAADDSPIASRTAPLPLAHAHNDFEHPRPLNDALDNGFCSVEADVFLKDGELLVGHHVWDLRPNRTLESLYLRPLRDRVRTNGGRVYRDGPAFYLLVDVKTEAEATYAAISKVLAKYDDILSAVSADKLTSKAVTVVISGNCARKVIAAEDPRFAAIDGRPADLESTAPTHLTGY